MLSMRKKAQSFNEYALVIALITLVGIGMQTYIKRGIQAVIKGSADVLMAGGIHPAAPVPAADILNPMQDLADGSYYGINFQKYWHPAFIKEYIEWEWGYLGATLRKNADGTTYYRNSNRNYEVSFLPAAARIEMVKDGNDVYYKLHTSDPESPITVARENATTHDLTLFYTSAPSHRPPNATYNYLGNSALPYNDALAQQKGIEEPGLYKFNQTTPLTVISNKSITVNEYALKTTVITHWTVGGKNNWNPTFVKEYLNTGKARAPVVERTGNNIYYYDYPTLADAAAKTNGIIVGGEDAITRDFTSFGPEGYPDKTYDVNGKEIRTYSHIKDSKTGEILGALDDKGNSYKKYQIVRISTTSYSGTSPTILPPVDTTKRTKLINNDQAQVSGAWDATYKLGTDIYKPKPKPK